MAKREDRFSDIVELTVFIVAAIALGRFEAVCVLLVSRENSK